MWLILCASNDISAIWAYQGLKARGLMPLELVSSDMLAYSLYWEHRLSADDVSINLTLADGRTINNQTICGVLNRLQVLPTEHLHQVNPADTDYANQELLAFFTSWLYALPQPVINVPVPHGLSGQWRHASEWVWLASQAGLPTPDYKQSSHDQINETIFERRLISVGKPLTTVIVIGGNIVGASPPTDIIKGCQRLADLANTTLLGVEFTQGSKGFWTFAGATPMPDLRIGGQALLDVLTSLLRNDQRGK